MDKVGGNLVERGVHWREVLEGEITKRDGATSLDQ